MSVRLADLDGQRAVVRKAQAQDRVANGSAEPLVRCRVWFEVEDMTERELRTLAAPDAAVGLWQAGRVLRDDDTAQTDRLTMKRDYAVTDLEVDTGAEVLLLRGASVAGSPALVLVAGVPVLRFTVDVDLPTGECLALFSLLGAEVGLTTHDLQGAFLEELGEG